MYQTQAVEGDGDGNSGLVARQKVPAILQAEHAAAMQAIASGLYVSFVPNPSVTIPASAADEIRNGTGQCCRVAMVSACRCGHALSEHKPVKLPKRPSFIAPPQCGKCRCRSYCYSPMQPEECGQWWLKRRRDFNIRDWQKVPPPLAAVCVLTTAAEGQRNTA